jgi:hypothetical protein
MSTLVNSFITKFIAASPHGALTNGMAVIAVVMLLTLLVEKVLLDAYEGRPIEHKTPAFAIVTLPLLFVMAVVILLRLAQILHLI